MPTSRACCRSGWTPGRTGPAPIRKVYETWRITPALRPLKQEVIGNVGDVLWVVMGTIGIVMLIACANVANLLLVRAEARQQELAIRAALGAGWGRIVRESAAGERAAGTDGRRARIGARLCGLRFLVAIGPANLPRLSEISLDARALGFTLCFRCSRVCLFGLIPALKYAGPRISLALRSAGRTSSAEPGTPSRPQHSGGGQVAMALVLLVSAGLMIRTFQALRTVEPGFTHAEHLQTMRIAIPASWSPNRNGSRECRMTSLDKLAAIPGVAFRGVRERDADGRRRSQLGRDLRRGQDVYAPAKSRRCGCSSMSRRDSFTPLARRLIAGRDFTWTDVYGRQAGGDGFRESGPRILGHALRRDRQTDSRVSGHAMAGGDRRGSGRPRERRPGEGARHCVLAVDDALISFGPAHAERFAHGDVRRSAAIAPAPRAF